MKKIIFAFFTMFLFISCHNDDDRKEIPECLKVTVDAILSQPVQTPRAKIEKWIYFNEEVYEIIAQNFPDGESFIISIDCERTICTTGGFDGPLNDCEIDENAEFIETIWTDPR